MFVVIKDWATYGYSRDYDTYHDPDCAPQQRLFRMRVHERFSSNSNLSIKSYYRNGQTGHDGDTFLNERKKFTVDPS